jgi:hypothetical protein
MSIARRRLVTSISRASMVSIERNSLKVYIKNNIYETPIENIVIFCLDSRLQSKQLHISFENKENTFYKTGIITYFENYIQTVTETFQFSHIGHLDDILYQLVKQVLHKIVPVKTSETFIINIGTNTNNWEININNGCLFSVDKTENGSENNNQCPVCVSDYNSVEKLTLKCNHTMCSKCFWTSIENNLNTCPLCRAPFFA